MEEADNSIQDPKKSLDVRLITHNIRYGTKHLVKGEERWPVRRPRLCSQLVFNSILPETFICLQEALHQQVVDVLASLNTPNDTWTYVGVGRDNGEEAGEYSPIFYRPKVWKLTGFNTRWLSQTPNVPSKGWDAACIRILTIGHFTHLGTGLKIVVLSTHFDHSGVQARRESAKQILEEIKSITATYNVATVLLAGDFNSPPEDGAYQIMTSKESSMEDIGIQIPAIHRYGNENTFTSFGHVDNKHCRIDFVFARKADDVEYRAYGVLANRFDDAIYLSDHRACVADVILKV